MLDDAVVQGLAKHWLDGWNGEDVDTIMEPFAEDVVFLSPFVGRVSGDPARSAVEGWTPLRDYVDAALRRTPGIRYELLDVYAGVDAVVLLYRCTLPSGATKRGADSMLVRPDGKVAEWRCHYDRASL